MLRAGLLCTGLAFGILNTFVVPSSLTNQILFFLTGLMVVGIPHGSADLLIDYQNGFFAGKKHSKVRFFLGYSMRMVGFGILLWIQPGPALVLFIMLASYHFGETDLHTFNTRRLSGKFWVISYGASILATILLVHLGEAITIYRVIDSDATHLATLRRLEEHALLFWIIGCLGFFFGAVIYFLTNDKPLRFRPAALIFVQWVLLICILYVLPLILGFTFYFVVWHSVLSLQSEIRYLRRGAVPFKRIVQQMMGFSLVAIAGICGVGFFAFKYSSVQSLLTWSFIGLAVLTAPHLPIISTMYDETRRLGEDPFLQKVF